MPSRRSSSTASRATPQGKRPPAQPLGPWLLSLSGLLLISTIALLLQRTPLLAWAAPLRMPDPDALTRGPLATILAFNPLRLVAQALAALLAPPLVNQLIIGCCGALSLIGGAQLIRLILLGIQQRSAARALRVQLHIRTLQPSAGLGRKAASASELLHALHAVLPTDSLAQLLGRGPAIALTMHSVPGMPIGLGILVTAPTPAALKQLVTIVRDTIEAHIPNVLVEIIADMPPAPPRAGTVRGWQRYRQASPSDLPLRTDAEADGDLLATLLGAIRAPSDVATTLQLVLRPLRGWELSRSWRAAGMRRLLRLQQQRAYAISDDVRRLEARLALPAFAVTLQVTVTAHGPAAATQITATLGQITNALGVYAARTGPWRQALTPAGGGRQRRMGERPPPEPLALPHPTIPSLLLPATARAMVLSIHELEGLWHLPTPALGSLIESLACRHLPVPPHAFRPFCWPRPPQPGAWINLGTARHLDGNSTPVGLTIADLRYVLHLTAGMGAGKSRLLANLCRQFFTNGLTLIDGKGDDNGSLANFVLTLIPTNHEARVVILDPRDARWPVGLNPLAGVDRDQPGALDQAVATIFGLFARIDPETWGSAQGMRDFLDKALRLVLASEPQPTLAHVKQALLDETYRAQLLPICRNRDVVDYWTTIFPRLGEGQRSSRDALLRRFDKLLSADLLRLVITRPQPALQLDAAIAERAILICPIPNVALGDLAGVYAMLFFQQFLRAAFARPGTDQDRIDYPLVIDELQVLIAEAANDDIETALSRLRSFAIPLVIAHQALSQLGPVEPLVHINAENRVILKVREPDASVYARQYGHQGLTASDIANQDPNTHQYAILRADGQPAGPFSMEPLPWPVPDSAALPAYCGPPWQSVLPADSPDPSSDRLVAQLVYTEVPSDELNRLAEQLARMPSDEFAVLLSRWDAIRQCQLAHIAAHPACISDKTARIRWRSRLRYALPYVLAEAQYRRARPAIAPETAESRRRGPTGAPASAGVTIAPEPPPFTQADRQPAAAPPPISAPRYPHDDDAG